MCCLSIYVSDLILFVSSYFKGNWHFLRTRGLRCKVTAVKSHPAIFLWGALDLYWNMACLKRGLHQFVWDSPVSVCLTYQARGLQDPARACNQCEISFCKPNPDRRKYYFNAVILRYKMTLTSNVGQLTPSPTVLVLWEAILTEACGY